MMTTGQMRIHLLEKAAEDEQFRARLLEDPHGTIAEELGVGIPEGLKINVLEDSADTTNIVLPPKARLEAAELEAVSGGGTDWATGTPNDDDDDRWNNAPQWWDANDYDE
ncbi:MAG: NHLP leader peptide family RiPP precursor, partial [Acidobacteriota bacterium]|nr:NHLP leader peptide family RiPP precursor [Acidobacteriota bacterium]